LVDTRVGPWAVHSAECLVAPMVWRMADHLAAKKAVNWAAQTELHSVVHLVVQTAVS
jgi:hypothetical protein